MGRLPIYRGGPVEPGPRGPSNDSTPMTDDEQQALLAATRALMRPLARLLVARGVPFAAAEESLKTAMIEAGLAAHPDSQPHRAASRVSAATGINRREVTRLVR